MHVPHDSHGALNIDKKTNYTVNRETNLLDLVNPWLDNNCQIQTKMLQYLKNFTHPINTNKSIIITKIKKFHRNQKAVAAGRPWDYSSRLGRQNRGPGQLLVLVLVLPRQGRDDPAGGEHGTETVRPHAPSRPALGRRPFDLHPTTIECSVASEQAPSASHRHHTHTLVASIAMLQQHSKPII